MKYGSKHSEWVLENAGKYNSYEQLASDFNSEFDTNKSVNAVQQFVTKKLGVYLITDKKLSHFSRKEEQWLRDNYAKYDTYKELVGDLNRVFCTDREITSVREKCSKQLKLRGIGSSTSYGRKEREQCLIGTIRVVENGATYIKVTDSAGTYQSGYREPYWLPIQKKIWIDNYGEVPDGKMVIFLDGNKENLDIKNLYCIDRKTSAILASFGWYSENSEITLTAIRWCELHYSLIGG